MYMLARNPATYRPLTRSVLCIGVLLLAMQTLDYINFSVDDVFIPLRIGQNVASGNGFVYNAGEYVEGHSDPLWVALVAAASFFGVSADGSPFALLWVVKGLSYLFGLIAIVLTYRLILKLLTASVARHFYAALGALALIICSPFVLWACSGLEMTFVAALYMFATHAAFDILSEGRPRTTSFVILGASFILASLTRPEAPLFAAAAFSYLFFSSRDRKRLLEYSVAPYIVICGAFLLWRYTTYGDLLPSAFYAKTSNSLRSFILGTKYFLGSLGGICGPLILTLPFILSKREVFGKIRIFMLVLIGATMIFTVYSSGDWMPAFRFLVLVAPLIATLGILALRLLILRIIGESTITASTFSIVAFILLVATTNIFVMRELIRGASETLATGYSVIRGHIVVDHERVARWLQQHLKDGQLVATGEAGMIGYLNPTMRLLDLNGLMDKKIAHDRKAGLAFDAEYIMQRKPAFIILYGFNSVDPESRYLPAWGDYASSIVAHPKFESEYELKAKFVSFDIFERREPEVQFSSIR